MRVEASKSVMREEERDHIEPLLRVERKMINKHGFNSSTGLKSGNKSLQSTDYSSSRGGQNSDFTSVFNSNLKGINKRSSGTISDHQDASCSALTSCNVSTAYASNPKAKADNQCIDSDH